MAVFDTAPSFQNILTKHEHTLKLPMRRCIVFRKHPLIGGQVNTQAKIIEPRHRKCPVNGKSYPAVSSSTLKHHLIDPWRAEIDSHQYYCCDDSSCDVIYFDEADQTIAISELRHRVGLKTGLPNDLLCFCFGVSINEARNASTKAFVKDQTKSGACACQKRNPFGRCCLKDFPQ